MPKTLDAILLDFQERSFLNPKKQKEQRISASSAIKYLFLVKLEEFIKLGDMDKMIAEL